MMCLYTRFEWPAVRWQAEFNMLNDRPLRFYIVLWTLALLSLAGAVAAKPLYRRYKHRKALELVAEVYARDFPAQDWNSVGKKLRLANAYDPREPEVLRLAARFLAIAGKVDALSFYGLLVESGSATVTDRLDYARQALIHNRPDVARLQARQVMTDSPTNLDALLVGIEALERLGGTREALSLALAAFRAHPTSDPVQLRLGLLQMADVDETTRQTGKRLLWGLAMSQGPFNARAVQRLASESNLERSELLILSKSMETVTNRTLVQDLAWYDLRYRLADETERSPLVSLVIQRLGSQSSPIERIQAADWLLAHNAPTRVPEVLDESLSRMNSAAAQRWIQAKANAGGWDEVGILIEDATLAIDPELRHCYRALMQYRSGNTNAVAGYLQQALGALRDNPEKILIVASYAEKLRQPKLAAAAYEKLLSFPFHAARAAQEILRLLGPSDDVQNLLSTLRRLQQFQPDSADLADMITWYELVIKRRVAEHAAAALERFKMNPGSDRFRLTAALAQLRQNNPDAALSLLESRYSNPTNLPPRARLLYTAAVGGTGQRQNAERLAELINPGQFKPEEFELIRPWREVRR